MKAETFNALVRTNAYIVRSACEAAGFDEIEPWQLNDLGCKEYVELRDRVQLDWRDLMPKRALAITDREEVENALSSTCDPGYAEFSLTDLALFSAQACLDDLMCEAVNALLERKPQAS